MCMHVNIEWQRKTYTVENVSNLVVYFMLNFVYHTVICQVILVTELISK